ncbi:MAG: hypothetical protein IJM31_06460, partial [Campylobacter sp.]|nr:hypothetical protein [Campylobacter sp.]
TKKIISKFTRKNAVCICCIVRILTTIKYVLRSPRSQFKFMFASGTKQKYSALFYLWLEF